MLRDGGIVATDDAGRAALLLLMDPWTLDRLLAYDADAADLDDNCEPPHRVTRNTGQDRLLPRRLGDALRIVQALALALLLVTVPHAVARSDQAPAVTLPLSAAEAPT